MEIENLGFETQVWNPRFLVAEQKSNTVGPRDTRPQDARTLTVHVFELGPYKFEMHEFM